MALLQRCHAAAHQITEQVAELVERPVDALVAVGPTAARAARGAAGSVPVVFTGVPDPVQAGLVADLARPGEELGPRRSALQQACRQIGRSDVPPVRMSVRVGFPEVIDVPGSGERPLGQGTVDQVVEDFRRLRAAGLDQYQINFMNCRSLSHLLESMALFMREVRPAVSA